MAMFSRRRADAHVLAVAERDTGPIERLSASSESSSDLLEMHDARDNNLITRGGPT